MVRDGHTSKYRRTRLFVLTLGYSRKSVRLLVFGSSSQMWAELHEKAFRRLGGVAKIAVIDNLREGVLKPDIYDPSINPLYRDMLRHYNVVAMPCRVRDPDRKGKVERGVGHAKNTPLKGLRFESLEEAQTYLDHWETHWADTRIHGTTKRQVAAMFAEEKPTLQPLGHLSESDKISDMTVKLAEVRPGTTRQFVLLLDFTIQSVVSDTLKPGLTKAVSMPANGQLVISEDCRSIRVDVSSKVATSERLGSTRSTVEGSGSLRITIGREIRTP
jgi:hypothetical protein